jgi:hypothetical protein
MSDDLPEDGYLATHYCDSRTSVETRRVYYEDGRVEAFDGKEWWPVARLAGPQIEAVKQAVRESGIMQASDLNEPGVRDTAELTYAWQIAGQAGSVTNYAYPAKKHPTMTALDRVVDPIVNAMRTSEE